MELKKDDSCGIQKSSFNACVVFSLCPLFGVRIKFQSVFVMYLLYHQLITGRNKKASVGEVGC